MINIIFLRMKTIKFLLILAIVMLTACDDESQYSIYRVNFVFDKIGRASCRERVLW